MEIAQVSFQQIIYAVAILIVVWEAVKKMAEMKHSSDKEHERRMGWDYAAKTIKEKEQYWDDAFEKTSEERAAIVERYDLKLAGLEDRIEMVQCDSNAKNQEVRSTMIVLVRSVKAVLEGLIEQGCDGEVKKAKEELDSYLTDNI